MRCCGLVAARLIWGMRSAAGTREFGNFVPQPRTMLRYLLCCCAAAERRAIWGTTRPAAP